MLKQKTFFWLQRGLYIFPLGLVLSLIKDYLAFSMYCMFLPRAHSWMYYS